ncbi:MAG: succinyl-CoA synthetase alpha subunit [Archaeoglobi archaeon]|nr:succinyl-CoA synthetase alpha subunit [Archaeoglobi archaeon]
MGILIDENTRVVVQGITGREAASFTEWMIDYGTKVVAGVTPGKEGMKVHGVPVYNTVKSAVENHDANTSVVSVPPRFTKDAVMEAIDAGIELVSVFTERVPRSDVVEMIQFAKDHGARIIGPNSLGSIVPGKVKLAAIGGPTEETNKAYTPGPVAVLSRSGGMMTETCSLMSVNGIGQSVAINVGGDPIVGSMFHELMPLLEKDPETKAVVIYGEPGTVAEETLADYIKEYGFSKPVVAFIGGGFVDKMPGQRFGHAAVIVTGKKGSVEGKKEALRDAGVLVADYHSEIITLLKEVLKMK